MWLKIPTKHIDLILVGIMAFLCASVLILSRDIAVKENPNEWLLTNKATAISCNKNEPAEPGSSEDKNNGGGCAHQLGASGLLAITADKRNKIHSC